MQASTLYSHPQHLKSTFMPVSTFKQLSLGVFGLRLTTVCCIAQALVAVPSVFWKYLPVPIGAMCLIAL